MHFAIIFIISCSIRHKVILFLYGSQINPYKLHLHISNGCAYALIIDHQMDGTRTTLVLETKVANDEQPTMVIHVLHVHTEL